MESYQLTPDLAAACEQDITTNCQKKLEAGGRTVHCLMKHLRGPKKISDQCRREVEKMVKVSGESNGTPMNIPRLLASSTNMHKATMRARPEC